MLQRMAFRPMHCTDCTQWSMKEDMKLGWGLAVVIWKELRSTRGWDDQNTLYIWMKFSKNESKTLFPV